MCGAPIQFRINTTLVAVCDSCDSVIARGDRTVEHIGKVADLIATRTPLELWLEGHYDNVRFQVVGRAQLRHGKGGLWDEWYLAFDDGRWGWLAEAQGKFYLTFAVDGGGAPDYDSMVPGYTTTAGGVQFNVAERGEAQQLSAAGEIPYRLIPGSKFRFADLSGEDGAFATVDYGDGSEQKATVYAGREVTLADLGLHEAELRQNAMAEVSAEAVSCPNCGGSLELAAPDQSQRVICPYCDTVLDADHGTLKKLETLRRSKVEPTLPLGTTATFDGVHYKVIGFLQRHVKSWGVVYSWDEYLLYEPRNGYRWLVCNSGHWSFVEPVPAGEIKQASSGYRGAKAEDGERTYKIFTTGKPRIDYAVGEFYWRISVGQRTHMIDYINPPYMLSREQDDGEVNWSRGRYLSHDEINGATDCPVPKTAAGVAANQPYRAKDIYVFWAIAAALALLATLVVKGHQANHLAHDERFELTPHLNKDAAQVVFSKPFELKAHQNIIVRADAPVNNSWVYIEADLVNTETGAVAAFTLPIEYYHGYDWKEGGRSKTRYLSAMSSGKYLLRMAIWRKNYFRNSYATIRVSQGKFRARYWLLLFLGISIIPIGVAIHHRTFEKRRWSESDYADDDDE